MSQHTLPGIGLTGFWDRGADYKDGMDQNLLSLSALTQLVVESRTTALPGSPADGLIYIVRSDDATNPNKIAIRDNGAWVYRTPQTGWRAYVKDSATDVRFSGSAWTVVSSGGGSAIAVKDEGATVLASPSSINFVGAGVTATNDGAGGVNVTVAGGSGSVTSLENALTAPPVAANWIKQNFDATKTHLDDFTSPVPGVRIREDIYPYGNTNLVRYALRAVPSTRWQVTARLRRHTRVTNFMAWGMVVRDSASGRSVIFGFDWEAGGFGGVKMSNDTTYESYFGMGGNQMPYQSDIWFRLAFDGTNSVIYHSFDGVYWTRTASFADAGLFGYLPNAATHVGFGYNVNNAGGTDLGQEVDLLSWQATALA